MQPFSYKNAVLHFESINLETIIADHGTPVFIAFRTAAEKVLDAAEGITAANSGRTKIFISVKTNDDPAWLRECGQRGFGMEVVSALELDQVIHLGCIPAENILYNGPAKTIEDIAFAIAHQVAIINIDSYSEVLYVKKITENMNQRQAIGIRVCLDANSRWNKFGVIPGSNEWKAILSVIQRCPHIQLEGLHFHEPSTMGSPENFYQVAQTLVEWAEILSGMGFTIKWLDFGGGKLPNDYDTNRLLALREWINYAPSPLKKFHVFVELGKSLVNDVFILAAKCITVKDRGDKRLLILNAGVNVVGGRHANMQYSRYYPLQEKQNGNRASTLCGPMCFPTDIIDENAVLPEDFGEEDILVIPSCGAYTLSLRWKGILNPPSVVWK